jgi:hypothetical protein
LLRLLFRPSVNPKSLPAKAAGFLPVLFSRWHLLTKAWGAKPQTLYRPWQQNA